jgi:hypothetical protein
MKLCLDCPCEYPVGLSCVLPGVAIAIAIYCEGSGIEIEGDKIEESVLGCVL